MKKYDFRCNKIKMRNAVLLLFAVVLLPTQLLSFSRKSDKQTTLVFPSFLHTYGIRKATKTHLLLYTRNRVKVRNPQGLAVTRLQSWDDPKSKKDDDEVTGYGVNSGANMIVYNTSIKSLGFYGLKKKGQEALNHPLGIAANALGDVYVADTGNDRIMRLFNPKKKLQFVQGIGGKGALPGQFNQPHDVALDADNFVYITDTANHRVQVLRADNQLHSWFGKAGVEAGQFWHPTGIAVTNGHEKWSHFKDRFIVVIDLDGTRIQKFTLDGKFVKAVSLQDFGFKTGKLMYLALDYYSQIWATDFVNGCVHKFDRNLNYLTTFGKEGTGDREFEQPRGIAIYKRFGQVFIAEKESAQYYWIGTDIKNVAASFDSAKKLIRLDFFLTEPSFVSLEVEKSHHKIEKTIMEKVKFSSGKQSVYLDGGMKRIPTFMVKKVYMANLVRKENGSPVQPGNYTFHLKIEPTYSSYKYFSKKVETTLLVE